MNLRNTVLFAAAIFSAFPVAAQTAAWNKVSTVTINEAIEVPGAGVLQPGTYTFRLADVGQGATRHTVQILNKEQTRLIATVEAIPNERLRPTGKTVLSFYEMPTGQPEALRAWFYPGDNMGQEFAYPKSRAAEISKSTNVKVPEENTSRAAEPAPVQTQASVTEPIAASATPPAAPVSVAENTTPEPAPANVTSHQSSDTVVIAKNYSPQSASTNDQSNSATQTLPETASDAPLAGLIGLAFLAAAGVLRFAPMRMT